MAVTDLIPLARAGQSGAIAELYDRCATGLFRTAYRLSHSVADAEDVVHDVW